MMKGTFCAAAARSSARGACSAAMVSAVPLGKSRREIFERAIQKLRPCDGSLSHSVVELKQPLATFRDKTTCGTGPAESQPKNSTERRHRIAGLTRSDSVEFRRFSEVVVEMK